jgi:TatD DNase family protein
MTEKYPEVYATVGVHPNDAPKADDSTFADLRAVMRHPKVRAIGEIGLDFHWGVPKQVQTRVFIVQLEIAAQARMPVVIHTREAWTETMDVLRKHWAGTGLPCVMHCFTGNSDQAKECLELGFYLAFGGVSTFPRAGSIRDAAKLVPQKRLLLETDAPYLAPVPYRGKRNEPSFVSYTAQVIAKERGISTDQLAAETSQNFVRIFTPIN